MVSGAVRDRPQTVVSVRTNVMHELPPSDLGQTVSADNSTLRGSTCEFSDEILRNCSQAAHLLASRGCGTTVALRENRDRRRDRVQ